MRKGENNVVNTPKKDMVIKEIMLTFEDCIIHEIIVKIFSWINQSGIDKRNVLKRRMLVCCEGLNVSPFLPTNTHRGILFLFLSLCLLFFLIYRTSNLCLQSKEFSRCHRAVSPEPYFSSCVYDMCVCMDDPKCLCDILASYAHECARANIRLEWRSHNLCGESEYYCIIFFQIEAVI